MSGTVIALALIVLSLPSTALAQAKKGDKEILLFGNLSTIVSSGNSSMFGNVLFNIGFFPTNALEVGGGPTVTFASAGGGGGLGGGGGTTTTVGANGFVRANLPHKNAKVVPYVGGEVNVQDFSNAGATTFIAGSVGVKSYLSEKAALETKGVFGFQTQHFSTMLIQLTIGLTFVF